MNVFVSWDPNPESNITGYKLYYGPFDNQTGTVLSTTDTFADLTGLPDGQAIYFSVSAVDTLAQEGARSDLASVINPFVTIRTA